jgi:hypothetical protein
LCYKSLRSAQSPSAGLALLSRLTSAPIIREIATPRGSMAPAPSLADGSGLISQPSENSNREKGHPRRGDPSPGMTSPSRKGEQKAKRKRLRLETIATRTKQKPDPISNREKGALFSGAGGAEKRAGLKARPYDGSGERNSNREKDTSPRKPRRELEKHKIAPPIFVSI